MSASRPASPRLSALTASTAAMLREAHGRTLLSTRLRPVVLVVAGVAIAVAGGGGGAALVESTRSGATTTVVVSSAAPVQQTVATVATASASSDGSPISAIAAEAARSVVEIDVTSTTNNALGQQTQQAQGSGFVYDARGHLITNAHVVNGATRVDVLFADGSTYRGTVVGTDPASYVAVV